MVSPELIPARPNAFAPKSNHALKTGIVGIQKDIFPICVSKHQNLIRIKFSYNNIYFRQPGGLICQGKAPN
jgi:hypothetical protein